MVPRGGEEVVYAPAGHNTTLTCNVSGMTLLWEVNGFRFGQSTTVLHDRGIFEGQVMNSSTILTSTLSVLASDTNHEVDICCLSRLSENASFLERCCTSFSVYGELIILWSHFD